ncbi:hypothetical protein QLQ12_13055 [Actinoplanes sp. NEAU-A12]|uniref:Repeat protein (TIGR01451 family) n=1 Tax=Actinoplanes sandaracinus TaxID=3045177 RepID=A0ABT6WIG8_9ACTN|nr:hypothetical protein [Actinoplanes sandaracinus]MDI6099525.1 hypothetical protein [Actinoplanes sandaracinus]
MRSVFARAGAVVAALGAIMAVSVASPFRATPALAAQTVCPTAVTLTNGDFEQPVIPAGTVQILSRTLIPGWQTTAPDKMIELWRGYGGVPAASGSQHAELNANVVSTLYQDLATTPGQTLRWQLNHRGRTGTDTMAVMIGPPAGSLIQQGPNISDPKTAWGTYTGTYTVPAGQTSTRFAFKSVSSATADPSVGNFLDGISFGSAACLTTTTSVVNTGGATTANVGDTLTYTVTARNDGGSPARLSAISDALPAGTTYVPGSLRSVSGSTTTKPTDAAGDDAGEYVGGSRAVNLRVGAGAGSASGGTLAPGESQTLSYQVTVNSSTAGTTLNNDAATSYTETVTNSPATSTSNTAAIAVNPAADLSVTAALVTPAVVAGQAAGYTLTASNAGPSSAGTVQLIGTVPAGLTGVTATSAGGACTVAGTKAQCDYPSIASGATRTMTISGNVPSTAEPGTAYTLAASVTSATYETKQADNSASVSTPVTASANLNVAMTYSPSVPVGGGTITYTVTVTNQGPSLARGIVLSDPIPIGSTNASATVPGGVCNSTTTGTIECIWASLAPGATKTITITMTLAQNNPNVNNAVSIASGTPDPDVGNNIVTVTGAGALVADVEISLTLGAYTGYAGTDTSYTLTVRNNGPSIADNITFIPVLPPGVNVIRPTTGPLASYCTPYACTVPSLPSGDSVQLTGTIELTRDAQAGPGTATVTAISTTTDPNPANDKLTTNVMVLLSSDLAVSQTLSNPDRPGGNLVPGERARSVVTVTNQGITRAEGVLVQRPVPAGQPVPTASTAAGTCTFQGTTDLNGITPDGGVFICSRPLMYAATTWTITFDSTLRAGYTATSYARTATVSATSTDPDPANDSVTTTSPVDHIADIDLAQTTSTTRVVASDPVQFSVDAHNAGPSDATNVVVQVQPQTGLLISSGSGAGSYDPGTGRWSIPVLASGATVTLNLSGSAVSAGAPNNVVRVLSADGTDPSAANNTAQAAVTIDPAAASLKITSAATVAPASRQNAAIAGDAVTYRFTVVNDGNVAMNAMSVRDALTGTATCPGTSLAAGAQMTCTSPAPYTITQADFDAQQPVYNNASVTAVPPGGLLPATFGPAPVTVSLATGTASLKATVTAAVNPAGHTGAAQVGDTITYTYVVSNDGNAALGQVAVTDTLGGAANCPSATLAVGASMTCASGGPYTVTQSDVDAGGPVIDAATLSGRLAGSATTRTFGPFSTSVAVTPAVPSLTAVVTANVTPPARQGAAARNDTIGYSYAVTNNGNVTMSSIGVTDTRVGTASCPATPLAVNATMTCTSTASYTVSQADLDAGIAITDSATVSGRAPGSAATSYGPFTTGVAVAVAAPMLAVTVNPAVTPLANQSAAKAGNTIGYSFTVTNNGNVTMSNISVADSRLGAATCPAGPLAAGATVTCTNAATYTVTQGDVDAGTPITTSASVSGRGPGAVSDTVFGPVTAGVAVAAPVASLSISVAAAVLPTEHQSAIRVGDTISYTYTVVNDGNVTMSGINLGDALAGAVNCPFASLVVGASMTCVSASPFVVDQARIDAGGAVTASASATATTPAGAGVPFGPFTASVTIAPAVPSLNMAVTAFVNPVARRNQAQTGDTITYQYDITNTGNVTMSSIAVADTVAGGGNCPFASLAVGASMTCLSSSSYTVVVGDLAGASIVNNATLTARAPGAGVSSLYATGSDAVALVRPVPSLTVAVTPAVSPPGNQSAAAAGNTITYTFVVTNNGTVPMTAISLTDPKTGTAVCLTSTLNAGISTTCTGGSPYVVTQSDVDDGLVTTTVTAYGQSNTELAPRSYGSFTATVPVTPARPLLQLSTTVVAAGTDVGHAVTFNYAVQNIGNITMDTLSVGGTISGTVSCLPTSLAPSQTANCTGGTSHQIDQGDIDAGLPITDVASAVGRRVNTSTDLTFGPQTASAPVAAPRPSLTISTVETVSDPARQNAAAAGDTISYQYTITNDGNLTMDNLAVTDTLFGPVACSNAALNVGDTVNCTGVPSYSVTQADVDSGVAIVSDAHVLGQRVNSPTPYSYGPAVVSTALAPATASLTATVSELITPAGHQNAAEVDDSVRFRTVLTNTGNQTITGIVIEEPRAGTATCPATVLAPQATMTCTSASPYTVTSADVDANAPAATTVTVSGRRPGDASSSTLLTQAAGFPVVSSAPALTVSAAAVVTPAGHQGQLVLGDSIAYRYTVRNTGNVTMTGIDVTGTRGGAATCPAVTLAIRATTTCVSSGTYQVTQPDVEAGQPITESAQVTARAAGTTTDLTFGPATATELMAAAADSLHLAVTAMVSPASRRLAAAAGDTIDYRYVVTNDGDVEVTGIAVDDDLTGVAHCPADRLAVGASMTCDSVRPHTVSQSEVDAGRAIDNLASVTGRRPGAPTDTTYDQESATVQLATGEGRLDIAISADVEPPVKAGEVSVAAAPHTAPAAGDGIRFRYIVTNNGNVTMFGITVVDTLVGTVTCMDANLAVGHTTNCVADDVYRVTQQDIDTSRVITTLASASGLEPAATVRYQSPPAVANTPVEPAAPSIGADQTVAWTDTDGDGALGTGDAVTSTIEVANDGNVTLNAIGLTGLPVGVTCPKTTLAPGERMTCVSDPYHLTAAEVAAGQTTFTVRANAVAPSNIGGVQADAPASITPPSPGPTTSPSGTSPSLSPSSTMTPSPSRTVTPTRAPSPTVTPSRSPSRTRTVTPSRTTAPVSRTPSPSRSQDTSPGRTPITGGDYSVLLTGGLILIGSGVALVLLTVRRARRFPS